MCGLHLYSLAFSTYGGEVLIGAVLALEFALKQHVFQLVAEAADHLCGVEVVLGWRRAEVGEVQQAQEPFAVAAVS